jgi:hypothetical protein
MSEEPNYAPEFDVLPNVFIFTIKRYKTVPDDQC